jgi:hypothetical protein
VVNNSRMGLWQRPYMTHTFSYTLHDIFVEVLFNRLRCWKISWCKLTLIFKNKLNIIFSSVCVILAIHGSPRESFIFGIVLEQLRLVLSNNFLQKYCSIPIHSKCSVLILIAFIYTVLFLFNNVIYVFLLL